MLKISIKVGDEWKDRDSPEVFERQHLGKGTERLWLCMPLGRRDVLRKILETFLPPLQLLDVLHTPRGEGEPGRYQSPEISSHELAGFLGRFETFLWSDARHDVWFRSSASGVMVVWDRHNELFIYGDVEQSAACLRRWGFVEGAPPKLAAHLHHYRGEFDSDAAALLRAFNWRMSPLQPSDIQFKEA